MINITKLRELLAAANQDIDQLVLFRNNHLPALLDRLEKLEAVAEAANQVRTSVDSTDRRANEWGLWSALATLNSKLGETE